MCDICREAMKLWPRDDDELNQEIFDQLVALAQLVDGIPGSHLAGTGLTGRPDAQ